jgi:hypothetical protein
MIVTDLVLIAALLVFGAVVCPVGGGSHCADQSVSSAGFANAGWPACGWRAGFRTG